LRPFKNSSRKDALELKHWVKASEDAAAGDLILTEINDRHTDVRASDYQFTKYNIENPHYVFSQDEYMKYLDGMLHMTPSKPLLKASLREAVDKRAHRLPLRTVPRV
jgi:hypothetical protein